MTIRSGTPITTPMTRATLDCQETTASSWRWMSTIRGPRHVATLWPTATTWRTGESSCTEPGGNRERGDPSLDGRPQALRCASCVRPWSAPPMRMERASQQASPLLRLSPRSRHMRSFNIQTRVRHPHDRPARTLRHLSGLATSRSAQRRHPEPHRATRFSRPTAVLSPLLVRVRPPATTPPISRVPTNCPAPQRAQARRSASSMPTTIRQPHRT